MAMKLDDLINELEEIINESQHIPLTQLVVLEERQLFDIIDRMRSALHTVKPQRSENTGMTQQMREQGLLTAADLERSRIIEAANLEADEIRAGADDYAREVLEDLYTRLDRTMLSVRSGLLELERLQNTRQADPEEPAS
jgi:cell division septum initiation protein DivIVA